MIGYERQIMSVHAKTTMERILDMEDTLADLERRCAEFEETTIPMLSMKFGRSIRECIDIKVERRVKEELSKILLDQKGRDARIFKLMEQVDTLEETINELSKKLEKNTKEEQQMKIIDPKYLDYDQYQAFREDQKNKKITAIRNQLRKEKGRGEL